MIDRLSKSRKDQQSDCCGGIIKRGETYNKLSFRSPKYGNTGNQIGIEFVTLHICMDCYNKEQESIEKCKEGHHSYTEIINTSYSACGVPTPEYTGEYICENCGDLKIN